MKKLTVGSIGLLLLAAFAAEASAQASYQVNSAFLFERYSFDTGLAYSEVTQLTLPLTLTAPLGNQVDFTLSGGFTKVSVTESDSDDGTDQEVSGLIDTEARLVFKVVPDRFNLLLTAVAPTGMEALDIGEEAVLMALSSQVVGFSTTSLGTGGGAGAGFVGAVPVGNMALGLAGSYTHAIAYSPVVGQSSEWKPGGQLRFRAGLEGTVGPRTYLRVATILGIRQKDQVDGEEMGGLGNQIHTYFSLNHGVGTGALTLYAINSYRSAPQIESTAVGAVRLPKGNLLALGGRLEIPVAREVRLVPRIEYRRLTEAERDDYGDGALEAAGSTLRIGADLRFPLSPGLALVAEGNGLFGNVGDGSGSMVNVNGFRGGVHLVVRR